MKAGDEARLMLAGWDAEDRPLGARILDLAAAVEANNDYRLTDFLDPREQDLALGLIKRVGLAWAGFGGWRRAERKRLALMPTYFPPELVDPGLVAVAITVKGQKEDLENLSHRDYLGAILNLGVRREKIGDILVLETGAQVIVTEELKTFLCDSLTRVHRFPVEVAEIDLEALALPPERTKEIRTTVASLRLDAIASSGFGTSRTKIAREIKGELIKLNWQVVRDPARPVKEGDVISLRGHGRLVVKEVRGETKKGRTVVVLERLY